MPMEAAGDGAGRPVFVVGFGRSGTSLVARLLALLGARLGRDEDLLLPVSGDNPRGYFEPAWMVELNDEILSALDTNWWQPFTAPDGWERATELDPLRERARSLLAEKLGEDGRWACKDPRLTLTLPFWRELVPDAAYVVCIRNPADAIASHQRREDPTLPTPTWGALWLEHTARALAETAGWPRHVVFYEDLLSDPAGEVERLARFLGTEVAAPDEVLAAVEPGLSHHTTSAHELAGLMSLPPETRLVFLALKAAHDERRRAQGASELADAAERIAPEIWWSLYDRLKLPELQRGLDEANARAAASDGTVSELAARVSERDVEIDRAYRALDEFRASRTWRLTEPLRTVARRARERR